MHVKTFKFLCRQLLRINEINVFGENLTTVFSILNNCLILISVFDNPTKWMKQLKIASTTVEMFEKIFFFLYWPNMVHLCHKNPISYEELSFYQLIFQFLTAFSFFKSFFSHICSKMHHFSSLKHFYASRFRFQQMSV